MNGGCHLTVIVYKMTVVISEPQKVVKLFAVGRCGLFDLLSELGLADWI